MGLLHKLRHVQVLQALQIDDTIPSLPCLSKCPICGQSRSLEVFQGAGDTDVYRCTNDRCAFVGDSLDLYTTVRGITLEEAIPHLVSDGLVNQYDQIFEDLSHYDLERNSRSKIREFWYRANLRFQQKSTYAAPVINALGLDYEGIYSTTALGRYMGVATGYEIRQSMGLIRGERRFVRPGYHYLILPLWSDPLRISGLTLIYEDEKGVDWKNLRLCQMPIKDLGMGFLHSYRVVDNMILVYTNPLSAMRMVNDCAAANIRPSLLYAVPGSRKIRQIPGCRKLIINLEKDVDTYRLSLENHPSLVVDEPITAEDQHLAEINCCTNIYELLGIKAAPSYRAVGHYLAGLEPSEASFAIQRLQPDTNDINRILAAGDSNRMKLTSLLKSEINERRVRVSNRQIYESIDGWMVETKSGPELVSDTRFTIDTIYWDGQKNQALASGTIYQQSEELSFQSPWDEVKTRTYQWLERQLLDNQLQVPDVRGGWKNRLLDISRAFHRPNTEHAATSSRWAEGRLHLPQIIVENGKIRQNEGCRFDDVVGSGFQVPEELTMAERRALADPGAHTAVYWALFTALARNTLAPIHRQGTTGIAIVEPKEGLLSRILSSMRSEIGFESITFETSSRNHLAQVLERERRSPLPIWIDDRWNTGRGFKQWLESGPRRNCIVQMDPEVKACTALQGGWTYVSCDKPEGDGWRSLEGMWRIYPQFIAFIQRTAINRWNERSFLLSDQIMDLVEYWLEQELLVDGQTVLRKARNYFTQDQGEEDSTWGGRFVSFLIEALGADRIRLRSSDGPNDPKTDLIMFPDQMVFVSHTAVCKLFKSLGVREFDADFIRSQLQDIGVLKAGKLGNHQGYGIDIFQWNLTSSSRTLQT